MFTDDMITYVENAEELTIKLRSSKPLMQDCSIAGYYTEVSLFPIYQQWTIGIWNLKYDAIYINNKKWNT